MSDLSANLSLPLLLPSQAQKHVTHNEALELLDLLAQLVVTEFDALTPPALPVAGVVHALGVGATGDWAGQDGALAAWTGEAWRFVTPRTGWVAAPAGGGAVQIFGPGGWQPALPEALDGLTQVGVNTGADSTNRLAISAAATLLTHEGAGHQLKINKAAAADTASLLFQSGWSGRAEMGLAGTEDFSVKLSADGSSWVTGLALDRTTGDATLRGVQADRYGGPGLLGVVAQVGGVPSGAVIEAGSNANGHYVRWADGTQICWVTQVTMSYLNGRVNADLTFPAAFADAEWVGQLGLRASTNAAGVTYASDATPSSDKVLSPFYGDKQAIGCRTWAETISGMTAFQSGDLMYLDAAFFGRWF